jgi:uncharacterized protein with NRDE domain
VLDNFSLSLPLSLPQTMHETNASTSSASVAANSPEAASNLITSLLAMMHDTQRAPDGDLPATGVSLELERMLSSMFIASDEYGTRCSTACVIDRHNVVRFAERTYATPRSPRAAPTLASEVSYTFTITPTTV